MLNAVHLNDANAKNRCMLMEVGIDLESVVCTCVRERKFGAQSGTTVLHVICITVLMYVCARSRVLPDVLPSPLFTFDR